MKPDFVGMSRRLAGLLAGLAACRLLLAVCSLQQTRVHIAETFSAFFVARASASLNQPVFIG